MLQVLSEKYGELFRVLQISRKINTVYFEYSYSCYYQLMRLILFDNSSLNYSYTMIPSVDGSWGSLQQDGTFGGMIGMILRDEVEVSVADYLMTESRFQVVDYSTGLVVQK